VVEKRRISYGESVKIVPMTDIRLELNSFHAITGKNNANIDIDSCKG
jgi:hypothetical protein